MAANEYENFEIKKIKRSKISGADYNPRKINDSAKKKLKDFLKTNGLWSPLVWNSRTGTLVSGHQRLAILDSLIHKKDYELTVSVVDVDEKTEVKGNIFMNNPSAMGEWDTDILQSINDMFPDLDPVGDLGFDINEVGFIFDSSDLYDDQEEEKEEKETPEKFMAEMQKKARAKMKNDNLEGVGPSQSDSNYSINVVFHSHKDKEDFLNDRGIDPFSKIISIDELMV